MDIVIEKPRDWGKAIDFILDESAQENDIDIDETMRELIWHVCNESFSYKHSFLMAAYDGNRLVGAAAGSPSEPIAEIIDFNSYESHSAAISSIVLLDRVFYSSDTFVREDYHGKGIGSALIDQKIAHAKKHFSHYALHTKNPIIPYLYIGRLGLPHLVSTPQVDEKRLYLFSLTE